MTHRLSKEQREVVAEKIMDWGNLVFTGLVIAQLVPGTSPFQWQFFLVGSFGVVTAYISGILLMTMKGGEKT